MLTQLLLLFPNLEACELLFKNEPIPSANLQPRNMFAELEAIRATIMALLRAITLYRLLLLLLLLPTSLMFKGEKTETCQSSDMQAQQKYVASAVK